MNPPGENKGRKRRRPLASKKKKRRCVPGCFQLIFTLEMWQNELKPDSLHANYRKIFECAVVDKGKAGNNCRLWWNKKMLERRFIMLLCFISLPLMFHRFLYMRSWKLKTPRSTPTGAPLPKKILVTVSSEASWHHTASPCHIICACIQDRSEAN